MIYLFFLTTVFLLYISFPSA